LTSIRSCSPLVILHTIQITIPPHCKFHWIIRPISLRCVQIGTFKLLLIRKGVIFLLLLLFIYLFIFCHRGQLFTRRLILTLSGSFIQKWWFVFVFFYNFFLFFFHSHPTTVIRKDMKNVFACQTFSVCKSLDRPLALCNH
jgi:hypothetical protein